MENSPITGNQFNLETTRPNGIVDRAAVPVQGAANKMSAAFSGDLGAAPRVVSRVAEVAHQTADKVAEAATPTAQWLSGKGEAVTASGRNVIADARVYVAANPWQSLGVAVAAGFLVGRVAR